jgi:7-cyano-7-deazaguanine reductase
METTHLGQPSRVPASPDEAVLDYVPNPRANALYLVRFTAPEFTSLCPVTGQPDFAHLVIDYLPDAYLVESKSLKLYLGAHRNHEAFHEACTVGIAKRLIAEMGPVRSKKTSVKVFAIEMPCTEISGVLLNDVTSCAPGTTAETCLDRLALSSRLAIRFYK